VKAKDGDFYEVSSAESRLREMRVAFRTRPLMPGEKTEKRDRDDDREDPPDTPRPPARLTSSPNDARSAAARGGIAPWTVTRGW
jgi:hypothetical protein